MTKLFPRGFFSRIEVVAGQAIDPAEASIELFHQRVLELRGDTL
jgi:hypothetical protein